jgi:O-antigen/teichoic acid export membrane protein
MENQNKKKKTKKLGTKANFIFSLLIQLLTYIIPLITSPYLSRILGPTGIGENSFVNSVSSYFTLIISFGFLTYGIKEISRLQNNKTEYSKVFWNIVFSRGTLFFASFLVYFLVSYFWGFGTSSDKRIFLVYSISLLSSFLDISYLFQGLENFRVVSLITIFYKIICTCFYFVFVKTSDDLLIYVFIACLSTLLISLTMWFFAIRRLDRPRIQDIHVFKSLKNNLSYFLPTVAVSIYTILDRTMMGYLSTTEQVGYYEQAYKIIALVTGIINAISPVMLSRISSLVEEGNEIEVRHKTIQMSEVYALIGWSSVFWLIRN